MARYGSVRIYHFTTGDIVAGLGSIQHFIAVRLDFDWDQLVLFDAGEGILRQKVFFCGKRWFRETVHEKQFGSAPLPGPNSKRLFGSGLTKFQTEENILVRTILFCKSIAVNILRRNWPVETYRSDTFALVFFKLRSEFLNPFEVSDLLSPLGEGKGSQETKAFADLTRFFSESTHQPPDRGC